MFKGLLGSCSQFSLRKFLNNQKLVTNPFLYQTSQNCSFGAKNFHFFGTKNGSGVEDGMRYENHATSSDSSDAESTSTDSSGSESESDEDHETGNKKSKALTEDGREVYTDVGDMSIHHERRFMDKLRLRFFGGNGGGGSIHWELRRGKSRGKALGGSGGKGQDVIIKSDYESFDLSYIRYFLRNLNFP